jgi:RHS repeat-associated protein
LPVTKKRFERRCCNENIKKNHGSSHHATPVANPRCDALGSPVAATDSNGNLLWREEYEPYGERILREDGGTNSLWYTGKQEEEAFGISYFGARWYDPGVGRFMGVDAAGFSDTNIHSFNKYSYVSNNPYKYVDPDGNVVETAWDIFNVALDFTSLGTNLVSGNIAGAALDIAAIVVDVGAALLPGVPGGAGAIIKASREGAEQAGKLAAKKGDTLKPGPFAKESIPARGPKRDFNKAERSKINDAGRSDGCHTCGKPDPATKSGNFIPDHQPPNALNTSGGPQRLFPHCKGCSKRQGGQVTQAKNRLNAQ